jgi:peroxiredoxin
MKRRTLGLLGALLLSAAPGTSDEPVAVTSAPALEVKPAAETACDNCVPSFSIVSLDGDVIDPESLRGRVTFLHFFRANDVPPDEMWVGMQMLSLWSKRNPVQVVGVAAERDERLVRRLMQEQGMMWPVCVDADQKVRTALGVSKFPTQIVVDHEGRIVYRASSWAAGQTARVDMAIGKAVDALRRAQKAEAKTLTDERKDDKKKD